MALNEDDVTRLDERAQQVGESVGYRLRFVEAPNKGYVGVVVVNVDDENQEHQTFVMGPRKLADLAALDIDLDLDALERGERHIVFDEEGDPWLR